VRPSRGYCFALTMEAAHSSETVIPVCQTAQFLHDREHTVQISNTYQLMLYREIIAVRFANLRKRITCTPCGQNAGVFNIKY
jgi:hypothetical protein